MFWKITITIITFSLIFYLARRWFFEADINLKPCRECDGKGYWLGTRGEKNTCKVCGGNGRRSE